MRLQTAVSRISGSFLSDLRGALGNVLRHAPPAAALKAANCRGLPLAEGSWPRHVNGPVHPARASLPQCLRQLHTAGSMLVDAPEVQVGLERLSGENAGITVLSLSRPEAKNAIGSVLLRQLMDNLAELRDDATTRAVVLRSTVDRVFCAGADLKERRKMSAAEVQAFVIRLRGAFTLLETLPMPTLAAIDGVALGGGLEMALACDIRVAGSSSSLALPETALAIIPGAGGTQRLPRLVGTSRAKELIFTGMRLDAARAEEIGLINQVVPDGEAFSHACAIGRQIAARGPVAVAMAKLAVDGGSAVGLQAGLLLEEACYSRTLLTEDRLEGLDAFAEKRKPEYRGC